MIPAPLKRTTTAYWLWRIAFEWRTHVSRKVARHYNRASQARSIKT
jgi:hypothetical protein